MSPEMTNDLSAKLSALLDYIGSTAKDADGFVREQAPLVAQEIVSWHLYSSLLWLAFWTFIFVASLTFLRMAYKSEAKEMAEKKKSSPSDEAVTIIVILGVVAIATVPFSFGSAYQAVKALVAPRLVILEYVKSVS